MADLWLQNGNLVIDDTSGDLVLCDDCPCVDCQCDLRLAIRERQQACGITNAFNPSSPTTPGNLIGTCAEYATEYTVAQFKIFINYIATAFISGTYDDTGETAEPTMCTSSYANAATTCAELYNLTVALVSTCNLGTGYGFTFSEKNGSIGGDWDQYDGYDANAVFNDAVDGAIADWAREPIYASSRQVFWDIEESTGVYQAAVFTGWHKDVVTGLSSVLSKTCRFFDRGEKVDWSGYDSISYSTYGIWSGSENEWYRHYSEVLSDATTNCTSSAVGWTSSSAPPSCPIGVPGTAEKHWEGLFWGSYGFVIVDWSFTYV